MRRHGNSTNNKKGDASFDKCTHKLVVAGSWQQ